MRRIIAFITLVSFVLTGSCVRADGLAQPVSGQILGLSLPFQPPLLRGLKLDPQNPFQFHFMIDTGETEESVAKHQVSEDAAAALIRYFMASVTIPDKDLWVTH
ncbi:MAG: hypothetical protein HQL20_10700 [Candidatus Omnitrophica bacterium]|nr:hypothetical protein [Candidatus Omnitrophota bacterium]